MKLFDLIKRNSKGEDGEERFDLKLAVKKAFTTNIVAKLLCIFAALCLWFYVMGSEGANNTRTFEGVELSFTKNEHGLQILSSDRVTVDVVLSGKRSVLNRMDASDINAVVDISDITQTGTDTFAITVKTTNETSVESFTPKSVELHLDEPISKTVSVKADYRGGTSDSELLYVGKIMPSKKNVVIKGPKDSVSRVSVAKAMVDLNFIDHSVDLDNIELELFDENGKKIEDSYIEFENDDDNVDVYVDVFMKRELPINPVFLHGVYGDGIVDLKITPESVLVKGEIKAVEALTHINTEPIDEKQLGAKENTFKIGLEKPLDIEFAGADGECTVTASVNDYMEKTIYVPIASAVLRGLPEGTAPTIYENGVTVTVCGVNSLVSSVEAKDILLDIHCEALVKGVNPDVPVLVEFSNGNTDNMYIKDFDYKVNIELN